MNRIVPVTASLICMVWASSCSASTAHRPYVSRPAPNGRVMLVPELQGGTGGWCMATSTETATEGSSGCGPLEESTGPIFNERCQGNELRLYVFALTTSEVAAVSVDGGTPIPTVSNVTLLDGLRAAAVEVRRRHGRTSPLHCPKVTPLDANGRPIRREGKPGRPQAFTLPGRRHWEGPARPPRGVCRLTATRLPREIVPEDGYVATLVKPYRGLLGHALLSCVSTVYVYEEEHHLPSAVLLDASHPGATPPPLPGMKPLAGHPGIFEAPGSEGEMAARRIPGAWLVVEEEDDIGLNAPVELLEHLHVTMHL